MNLKKIKRCESGGQDKKLGEAVGWQTGKNKGREYNQDGNRQASGGG